MATSRVLLELKPYLALAAAICSAGETVARAGSTLALVEEVTRKTLGAVERPMLASSAGWVTGETLALGQVGSIHAAHTHLGVAR